MHSSPSESWNTSVDHTSHTHSISAFDSKTEGEVPSNLDLQQYPYSLDINQWLSHKTDPWSPVNMYHQDDHGKAVTNHHDHIFEELARIEKVLSQKVAPDLGFQDHLSDNHGRSLDLHGTGAHSAPNPSKEIEQQNIISEDAEDNTIASLLSLEVKLAELQYKHERFDPQAMETHLEMAKSLERLGNYRGAEYHYRIITERHCLPEVEQVCLGSLLRKLGRIEESNTFLFRALTSFIIQFDGNSLQRNVLLFFSSQSSRRGPRRNTREVVTSQGCVRSRLARGLSPCRSVMSSRPKAAESSPLIPRRAWPRRSAAGPEQHRVTPRGRFRRPPGRDLQRARRPAGCAQARGGVRPDACGQGDDRRTGHLRPRRRGQ